MDRQSEKGVFISWARAVPRSRGIAQALGMRDFYIERMKDAPVWLVPLRYLLQSLDTVKVVWRERPQLIVAMNPPIILPLIVYLAARWLKAAFLIDSHTGAFAGRWGHYLFLHRFLSRRALATLVTNEPLRAQVEAWGATAFILEDRVPEIPSEEHRFTIGVISSFAPDEPVEAIIDAARCLPDFSFLMTGRVPGTLVRNLANHPRNVRFTGYLPRNEYMSLLHRVDALMVLVKRDLTLLCGAYEAVAVEKPLITSDWPVLRGYFNRGALYVDNTPDSIREAVLKTAECKERLSSEMRQLKISLRRHWDERFQVLFAHINSAVQLKTLCGVDRDALAAELTARPYSQSEDAVAVDR